VLAGWVDAAASLLLGSACPGCRAPCAHLCAACAAEVAAAEPFAVALPAAPVPFVPVVAAARYEELWQRCILAYKERTGWWLGGVLGAALALAVADALRRGPGRPDPLVLVPMPSQRATVRERGLDTTLLLARTAARRLAASGLATRVAPVLSHTRAVADQSGLDERQRRTNLAGALGARPAPEGTLVVVDDLATTGASLVEACRALASAGTPPTACAIVAATPRRDGRRC
jgi:predicted amidophosphoribosyltransferase